MKTLVQTYVINAPRSAVWNALVNPKEITAWGGGKARMSDVEGDKFILWNGDIYGKNLVVKKEKELQQEWTSGDWDEPSIVTFTLTGNNHKTTVNLYQENIPDSEEKDIANGWKEYYLGEIKKYLER